MGVSAGFVLPAAGRSRGVLSRFAVLSSDCALESADSLAEGGTDLGEALGAEYEQKNDEKNNYPFGAWSKHESPSPWV